MLLRELLGERYKEKPADASIVSHIYMVKGGYIRPVAGGIYSLLPPAKRIVNKIESIIREEMDRIGGQEVLFPVVIPKELWEESGRYDSVGAELLRFRDRSGGDYVLGMTHEEAAVHLARGEAKTYAKYPFMIYQIQTKFRDEARARGGLIRVREFTMKDAYSFHTTQRDLEQYYEKVHRAYETIFDRVGLGDVISVGSDSGMMGGGMAHEFMLLCDAGEDTVVVCEHCGYKANMEVAESILEKKPKEETPVQKIYTPGKKDIESLVSFMHAKPEDMIKAVMFAKEGSQRPIVVFIRADLEVNEAKLRRVVDAAVSPLTNAPDCGLCFGFCGPYQLDAPNCDVYLDSSLKGENNMACGANETDYHFTGICVERDLHPETYVDVAKVKDGGICPCCGKRLTLRRGVEVGNIFQLGDKYTSSMGMTYTDEEGRQKTPIMGCYGIGVGRLMACAIEAHHDEYGPIWPVSIAPWQIHICVLGSKKMDVSTPAMDLYHRLDSRFEVILDDRGVAPGVQFADADLLGVPIRIIVSERNLAKGQLEVITRDKSRREFVDIDHVEEAIASFLSR